MNISAGFSDRIVWRSQPLPNSCFADFGNFAKFGGLYYYIQLYKVQQFRCYRSGLRRLLGEYGGIEADRQTNSSRQQAAADS
jgi:hypothetical protein